MRKINIIIFSIAVVFLASCRLGISGSLEKIPNSKIEEDEKLKDDARVAAESEIEIAFNALKTKRDDYKNKMDGLKTAFGKIQTADKEVKIPAQVGVIEDAYLSGIYASLGYNKETNKHLNEAIKSLNLGNGNKNEEIKIVKDVLVALIYLEMFTKEILDVHFSDASLETIKDDKDKITQGGELLNEYVSARDAFIELAQKAIKEAASNKADEARVKSELKKIVDAFNSPTALRATE
nr:hypothetical protein LKV13_04965 [Borrelia sp. BU AG58]